MADIQVSPDVLRGALAEALDDVIARAKANGAPDGAGVIIDLAPLAVHVRAVVDGTLVEYLWAGASDFDDGAEGLELAVSALNSAALTQLDEKSRDHVLAQMAEKRATLHVLFDPATGAASVHVLTDGKLVLLGAAVEKAVTC
jgi:hypothetical protein